MHFSKDFELFKMFRSR
uniref:Uncharacterized protein n=1 Tax=Anguilla anguilla TaxID=7936 RepID=A0A0E9SHY8_ANGAN